MINNKKRLVALFAALSMTAAACGSSDDDAEPADEPTTEAPADSGDDEMEESEDSEDAADDSTAEDDADSGDDEMEESDEAMDEPGTIVEVATEAGSFTTLVAAIEAADLVETLSGDGPFTVFAPTDAAFTAALETLDMTAEELLADTELLTSVLTYHVISGEVPSSDVVGLDGESVATVNGADVQISVDGETVMVNEATVTAVDVEASNGVIHVIDSVLLPPAG